jgi:hypothetical protein
MKIKGVENMEFLNSIRLDYIFGTLIVFALFTSKIYLLPYLKSKGVDSKYCSLVEQALLLGGLMFRSDKVKQIISIALTIVRGLEILNKSSEEKHNEAVIELSKNLFDELNIKLSDTTLSLIIHLAVSLMGEKL